MQQDGVVHAGVISTMADHTSGTAAGTLMEASQIVLTSEFKLHLLRPARGPLTCTATVLKPGRLFSIVEAEVLAADVLVAKLIGTFAIVDQVSNQVIGSTRYANIEPAHRRLEIGWTWLTPSFQRTAANTEAKLMLLTHAFETLGAQRVEFKTDKLNDRSREAILRIGAAEEGIFRKHMIMSTGRVRDTVYFSIIDTEWPAVKAKLLARLA